MKFAFNHCYLKLLAEISVLNFQKISMVFVKICKFNKRVIFSAKTAQDQKRRLFFTACNFRKSWINEKIYFMCT